jgi:hypothetical protein
MSVVRRPVRVATVGEGQWELRAGTWREYSVLWAGTKLPELCARIKEDPGAFMVWYNKALEARKEE